MRMGTTVKPVGILIYFPFKDHIFIPKKRVFMKFLMCCMGWIIIIKYWISKEKHKNDVRHSEQPFRVKVLIREYSTYREVTTSRLKEPRHLVVHDNLKTFLK